MSALASSADDRLVARPGQEAWRPVRRHLHSLVRRFVSREFYNGVGSVYHLARGGELRSQYPWSHKVNAWRRGFLADSAAVYDFDRNDHRLYISDDMRRRSAHINPNSQFFRNKLAFRAVLLTRGFVQPETVAFIAGGNVALNPLAQVAGEPSRYVGWDELESFLVADGGPFIVKPENGHRGQGIFLAEVRDGVLVQRRGEQTKPLPLASLRSGMTLIERRVGQAEYWRALFPGSANTIRAVTMWAPHEPEPFLAVAAQRIGNTDTVPTDNWSGGGICARIDLETGRLGLGYCHPRPGSRRMRVQETHARHPITGAPIEGAVIPGWERIKDTVLDAARCLPTNRYVGWDVLVDEQDRPIILEGNGNAGLRVIQAERGLLADPRVRRFFEQCNVL